MSLNNERNKLGDPVPGRVIGKQKRKGRAFEEIIADAVEGSTDDLPEVDTDSIEIEESDALTEEQAAADK